MPPELFGTMKFSYGDRIISAGTANRTETQRNPHMIIGGILV